jgi:uncharacterized protein with PIN domain
VEERFLTDCNLGKLSKWLRILGYDTLYDREKADCAFLCRAKEEGRIALTRKRKLAALCRVEPLVLVKSDQVVGQIGEVLRALALDPDPARLMTRCLNCNACLEEALKKEVTGLVPNYVYMQYERYKRCPSCGRIFWPGTHRLHIEEILRRRSRAGRL